MNTCAHCRVPYSWNNSTSTLKMTYCTSLCEGIDLGFTIEAAIKMEVQHKSRIITWGATSEELVLSTSGPSLEY